MSRAFGYLARETLKSYALLSAALVVLFDLLAFLSEAQDIGEAHYTVRDALLVILLSTPALLVDLSPFVALLATLTAYDRLNATSELIALRAAGVSSTRLGLIAGGVAAGFMLVVAAVEVVARPLHLQASLLRMHETAATGNVLRGGGFWIRSGETFVNVAALEDARRPTGIRVFTFSGDSRLTRYQRAASADIVDATNWQLENVWGKSYAADGTPGVVEANATAQWQPTWDRGIALYDLPVTSFSMRELLRRVTRSANESIGAQAERTELWRRLRLPLAAIAYALLAAPFAMLSNIRGGRSGRLGLGAALAFLMYVAEQVVTNAGILAGLPIAMTAAVPPFLVLIFAALLMRRLN